MKTKALIICTVTVQLICIFVFLHNDFFFFMFHDVAHLMPNIKKTFSFVFKDFISVRNPGRDIFFLLFILFKQLIMLFKQLNYLVYTR